MDNREKGNQAEILVCTVIEKLVPEIKLERPQNSYHQTRGHDIICTKPDNTEIYISVKAGACPSFRIMHINSKAEIIVKHNDIEDLFKNYYSIFAHVNNQNEITFKSSDTVRKYVEKKLPEGWTGAEVQNTLITLHKEDLVDAIKTSEEFHCYLDDSGNRIENKDKASYTWNISVFNNGNNNYSVLFYINTLEAEYKDIEKVMKILS